VALCPGTLKTHLRSQHGIQTRIRQFVKADIFEPLRSEPANGGKCLITLRISTLPGKIGIEGNFDIRFDEMSLLKPRCGHSRSKPAQQQERDGDKNKSASS
jgi:hypothetical protein